MGRESLEAADGQSFGACQELQEQWSLLRFNLSDVFDEVQILVGLSVKSVIRLNILHKFFAILPFGVAASDSADHVFQFTLLTAGVQERRKGRDREDLIKTFFESLNLYLHRLMETVMQH
jgi:hypothetical protein